MKKMDFSTMQWPTVEQLEGEFRREKRARGSRFFLKRLAVIAVLALLAAMIVAFVWMPVLRVNGDSMAPGLQDGEVVIADAFSDVEAGDIIAFYYNNKLLIKRVIAVGGDTVSIDMLGNVDVNGERLSEPYVSNKALGECDIRMPYRVPAGYVFVMGDRRSSSLDSRSDAIGCVAEEQILGRVYAQLWPLDELQWMGRSMTDGWKRTD